MTNLINILIQNSTFPDFWKHGKISPIHKSGDRFAANNYRPVCVLPYFSKIVERIIYNQLYTFFIDNNFLSSCQHGFRSKHSTISSVITLLNSIYNILDEKLNVLVVFIDFSKAFDTILIIRYF